MSVSCRAFVRGQIRRGLNKMKRTCSPSVHISIHCCTGSWDYERDLLLTRATSMDTDWLYNQHRARLCLFTFHSRLATSNSACVPGQDAACRSSERSNAAMSGCFVFSRGAVLFCGASRLQLCVSGDQIGGIPEHEALAIRVRSGDCVWEYVKWDSDGRSTRSSARPYFSLLRPPAPCDCRICLLQLILDPRSQSMLSCSQRWQS
ncbi:hypothetical protein B0H21DRAFT_155377 [Amylocystis lapponica]|nr:hypothetical protein B0H21DRAFT_155377 [Amylocystis lapponica]